MTGGSAADRSANRELKLRADPSVLTTEMAVSGVWSFVTFVTGLTVLFWIPKVTGVPMMLTPAAAAAAFVTRFIRFLRSSRIDVRSGHVKFGLGLLAGRSIPSDRLRSWTLSVKQKFHTLEGCDQEGTVLKTIKKCPISEEQIRNLARMIDAKFEKQYIVDIGNIVDYNSNAVLVSGTLNETGIAILRILVSGVSRSSNRGSESTIECAVLKDISILDERIELPRNLSKMRLIIRSNCEGFAIRGLAVTPIAS